MSDRKIILPGEEQQEMNPIAGIMQQIGLLGGLFQQLEAGMVRMSQEMQAQGLMANMLCSILVENKIITKEEMNEHIKTEVVEPMRKSAEELKKRMQEAQEQQEQAMQQMVQEATDTRNKEPEEEPEVDNSDVVLASEKADNVIRFPNAKDEE